MCACTLYGNVLWYPEQFLIKHVPVISKLFDEKIFLTNRQTHIANRSHNLLKDSYVLCTQVIHIILLFIFDLIQVNLHEILFRVLIG